MTTPPRSEREAALLDAARDVCMYCGGRADPMRHGVRAVHGPNEAGNYTHHVSPNREELCAASSIYSRIRFEFPATTKEPRA